ncbi:MAG: 2-hydroxyacyl-CoA dehydratase family protein [Desulfobacula sp.]|jgi:bcr-type benzoyl-CoA reductase subunit C
MKEIEIFHEAVNHIPDTALKIQKAGQKIMGYLCSYAPEEIIYAAGFHPMRLFSSKSEIILAENHLQSYCCSLVRGVLEDSLSGKLDHLFGTVFPHTCDSMQRLSDIWRMNGKYPFFADVVLPAKLNTGSAKGYMTDVLARFKKDLEAAVGKEITDTDLKASILIFNQIRKNVSAIYDLNAQNPGIISAKDLYTLVKGSMIMDRKEAAGLLFQVADHLGKMNPPVKKGKRLILSGSVCDTPDIFDAIETAGGFIVGDDLCTGSRWFEGQVAEDEPPLFAIASRYLARVTCPAKHSGLTTRAENLISLVEKNKADGVVFLFLKFCDPHAFDYPYIREALDKKGIKSLAFEMDDQQQSLGQFMTRIETFIHML